MSDELIARLRWLGSMLENPIAPDIEVAPGLLREAADHIERMEAVLRIIGNIVGGPTTTYAPNIEAGEWRRRMSKIAEYVQEGLTARAGPTTNLTISRDIRPCPNCLEKDASIAELIETLQRTEAAKEKA